MLKNSTARISSPGLGRARTNPEKSDTTEFQHCIHYMAESDSPGSRATCVTMRQVL